MITYDKLWETMKEKQISQYRMIRYYGVSAGQLGRLKKNMYVSTHTIEMLCDILECRVEDILEYRPGKPADKEKDSDDDRIFYSQTAGSPDTAPLSAGKEAMHSSISWNEPQSSH